MRSIYGETIYLNAAISLDINAYDSHQDTLRVMMRDIPWPAWTFFEAIPSRGIRAPSPEWTHIRGAFVSMLKNIRSMLWSCEQALSVCEGIDDHLPVQE